MIGLVDGNNFFVSCEKIFNPSLEGKPVAVLSNQDGCVVSRSYEFKALNIPMGTPMFKLKHDIKRLNLVLISGNKVLYSDISQRVMACLRTFCAIEQYSIDEAFIYPQGISFEDLEKFGKYLRSDILKRVGIPCGVGFAPTKTLAKIANHLAKKSATGVYVLPKNPREILSKTPIEEVWGVGRKLAPRMRSYGIFTAQDLADFNDERLHRHFSIHTVRKAMELRGETCSENNENGESLELSQSLTYSRVFGKPVRDLEEILESVAHYTSKVTEKLRAESQRAGSAEVSLVYYPEYRNPKLEGGVVSAKVKFENSTDNTLKIIQALKEKTKEIFIAGRRYKKTGVTLFDLENGAMQMDLFAKNNLEPKSKLFEAVDEINRKFGDGTLIAISEGLNKSWKMSSENQSPPYTTSWKDIPLSM